MDTENGSELNKNYDYSTLLTVAVILLWTFIILCCIYYVLKKRGSLCKKGKKLPETPRSTAVKDASFSSVVQDSTIKSTRHNFSSSAYSANSALELSNDRPSPIDRT